MLHLHSYLSCRIWLPLTRHMITIKPCVLLKHRQFLQMEVLITFLQRHKFTTLLYFTLIDVHKLILTYKKNSIFFLGFPLYIEIYPNKSYFTLCMISVPKPIIYRQTHLQ